MHALPIQTILTRLTKSLQRNALADKSAQGKDWGGRGPTIIVIDSSGSAACDSAACSRAACIVVVCTERASRSSRHRDNAHGCKPRSRSRPKSSSLLPGQEGCWAIAGTSILRRFWRWSRNRCSAQSPPRLAALIRLLPLASLACENSHDRQWELWFYREWEAHCCCCCYLRLERCCCCLQCNRKSQSVCSQCTGCRFNTPDRLQGWRSWYIIESDAGNERPLTGRVTTALPVLICIVTRHLYHTCFQKQEAVTLPI